MSHSVITHLAIDYGSRFVGIAISKEAHLASPHTTLDMKGHDTAWLIDQVLSLSPQCIVIGQPPFGHMRQESTDLLLAFQQATDIPVVIFDEDLSSRKSHSLMSQSRTKHTNHALSACFILQQFLDQS
jgi:RNase H-fold protein (predicted Holliday junction resolvase)